MKAYRILQVRDGRPTTLFHGVDGSRTLPIGSWVEAEHKQVHDGSGGTTYTSGFHVMKSRPATVEYLERFEKERPLVVCKVEVVGTWPKSHSNAPVFLARHMLIRPEDWLAASNPQDHPSALPKDEIKQRKFALKI